jgi:hypothetical protein
MLNARQNRAYRHTCALYSPDAASIDGTTGKVTPASHYTLVASGVQCLFIRTPNVSDPIDGVGRGKRPTEFTTNHIRMDVAQSIAEAWIVRDTTTGATSTDCYIVQGAPRLYPNSGSRTTNFVECELATVESKPSGVS